MLKSGARWIMALFFIAAGANHFLWPAFYQEMMPPYLPWHLGLIYVSGMAEMALGVTVLVPRFRRLAGWGLIALLVAIFPANVHAAIYGFRSLSSGILWARLPFQFVFIAWVYWCCLSAKVSHERHT